MKLSCLCTTLYDICTMCHDCEQVYCAYYSVKTPIIITPNNATVPLDNLEFGTSVPRLKISSDMTNIRASPRGPELTTEIYNFDGKNIYKNCMLMSVSPMCSFGFMWCLNLQCPVLRRTTITWSSLDSW